MKKTDDGSVCRRGATNWKRFLVSGFLKSKAAFFAIAFVLMVFSGTATAGHQVVGPPWEFTFSGVLSYACGVRSAVAVGFTDERGNLVNIEVVDTAGNVLTVLPGGSGLYTQNEPCIIDQSGEYPSHLVEIRFDCSSRFPFLDIVVEPFEQPNIEFHSQSGACNWIPPLDLGGILEPVHLTAIHPEFVYLTKEFQLGLEVLNNLPIPLLVSVEVVPENDDVCSLASYATSSPGLSLREHEYLLERNGSVGLDPLNSGNELALGDMITVSATFKANAVGDCRLVVLASIKTATGLEPITFQQRDLHIQVRSLQTTARLGSMTAQVGEFCRNPRLIEQPAVIQPVEVAAGPVDVTATLHFIAPCSDNNDNAVMLIEKKDSSSGEWVPVPNGAVYLSSPGTQDIHTRVDLPQGPHEFRVRAMYWDDHWDWVCIGQMLLVFGAFAAVMLAAAVNVALLVLALILFLPIAAAFFQACDPVDLIEAEYMVPVEAIPSSPVDDIQRQVADLIDDAVGGQIDSLDHDAL